MSYKVLVVDDSSFFRRRVTEILNSDKNLTVIDVAVNGLEAVEKAKLLKPDVITMDIEMPLLNGIDAVKQIMAQAPTSILMFSSLTHEGAKATLEALEAGALDFLPKKFNEIAKSTEDAGSVLRDRVVQLGRRKGITHAATQRATSAHTPLTARRESSFSERSPLQRGSTLASSTRASTTARAALHGTSPHSSSSQGVTSSSGKSYKLLAIGTSTGGPIALQKILTQLPADFPLPIVLIQHMPATFTKAFANRLNTLCKISVKEADDGDVLKPGTAYLAPGGKQMLIDGSASAAKLTIRIDTSERVSFKPSVDITFATAAKVFGRNVLGIVLTGMGSDGKDGARMLKDKGSTIWAQDEATCVVYGMPQAVAAAGISEKSLALPQFASSILKEIQYG